MTEAGRHAFERLAGALLGEPVPPLPVWSGPGRLRHADRLDALHLLVFGCDDADDGRVTRPNARAHQRLKLLALGEPGSTRPDA